MEFQTERITAGFRRRLKCRRFQLFSKEVIRFALIHSHRQVVFRLTAHRAHQLTAVVLLPGFTIVAQVGFQRLLAPGAIDRVGDRAERRNRAITFRVLQGNGDGSVTTHRVSGNGTLLADRKVGFNQLRQLFHHVVVHLVMRLPRLLSRVDVKTRPLTQIVLITVSNVIATRAGVGCDNRNAQLRRNPLGTGFLHEVLVGAGQAGQPVQHWHHAALSHLRRQINRKAHAAVEHRRIVLVLLVPAIETFVLTDHFHICLPLEDQTPHAPTQVISESRSHALTQEMESDLAPTREPENPVLQWGSVMNHAADRFAFVHQIKGFIDVIQPHGVSDEVIQRKLARQIIFNNARQF